MSNIAIFTDGACSGNPGPGGLGLFVQESNLEISLGYRWTTNNRMELLAVIIAMELHQKEKDKTLIIHSDSKYVTDAINKGWLKNWVKTNFKDKKNKDLWERFLKIYQLNPFVEFVWVKGHNGHEENEIADRLATSAIKETYKLIDIEYEKINPCPTGL